MPEDLPTLQSISGLRKRARQFGFNTRVIEGEIQIKPASAKWDDDTTYYTDDLADACGTLEFMITEQGRPQSNQAEMDDIQRLAKIRSEEIYGLQFKRIR